MKQIHWLGIALAVVASCSKPEAKAPAPVAFFTPDPTTVGWLGGIVRFSGKKPAAKLIDMDQDPACAALHKGRVLDESVAVDREGSLANVFVYLKSGLEGKTFEAPAAPVTIDQKGCRFAPRVAGMQIAQPLRVTNSDPVTHNIHPQAQVNREWNQSQSPEDPPLSRRFQKPEVMIPVKCNVHKWMHSWIAVLDHPYFTVTGAGGMFDIPNVPPGTYTIGIWHETLGTQERSITLAPSEKLDLSFVLKGN